MRLHHIVFGSALIVGGFAFAAPMAWDRHVLAVLLLLALIVVGLVLATGSKLLDLLHPTRKEKFSRLDASDHRC